MIMFELINDASIVLYLFEELVNSYQSTNHGVQIVTIVHCNQSDLLGSFFFFLGGGS